MKPKRTLAILSAVLFLCISGACAQEPQQQNDNPPADPNVPIVPIAPLPPQDDGDNRQAPAPAARGLFISDNSQDQSSGQLQPDTTLLSSGQLTGLGSTQGQQRLFDPFVQVTESYDTNVGSGRPNSVTSLGGTVTFGRRWGRDLLTVVYTGADTFYEPDSSFSQAYHTLNLSQEFAWNRWVFRFRDNFLVSPQPVFGGLYTGAAGVPGQSDVLNNIAPSLQPVETILTGHVNILNNTAMGEIDYEFSRRATVTIAGTYALLDFSSQGYYDSHQADGRVGYNYALDAVNSMAIIYDHSIYNVSGTGPIQTDTAQISYGRKVTGRLAFQVAAGPEILSQNVGSSSIRSLSWSLSSSLTYRINRNTGLNLSYFHGTTGGSGVLLGANTDSITGSMNRQFTRYWSASLNAGYAFNESLASSAVASTRYENWYGGASVGRQIGREIRLNFNYGFQQQHINAGACPVLSCGLGTAQVAGLTLEWHPWEIRSR